MNDEQAKDALVKAAKEFDFGKSFSLTNLMKTTGIERHFTRRQQEELVDLMIKEGVLCKKRRDCYEFSEFLNFDWSECTPKAAQEKVKLNGCRSTDPIYPPAQCRSKGRLDKAQTGALKLADHVSLFGSSHKIILK